jgi:pimeloyl-ACP methyl ester carboxylesterase
VTASIDRQASASDRVQRFSDPKGDPFMTKATAGVQSSLLKIPGAKLYYEIQGSGPVLLMIPGGPTDAGIFAALAGFLTDRYTVVRYDPRGNSRSVLDGPPEDQNMDVHGDDAAQLLATIGSEPAFVLGSSGGAQIGLNLASRYPERVQVLVAHEPPCRELLPNTEEQRAFAEDVYNTYRTQGARAAMQKFMVGAGLAGGPQVQRAAPPSPEAAAAFGRIQGNVDYFLAHGFKPIGLFVPDVAALKTGSTRIVIGVGETSAGSLAYRAAVALAERLGTAPVLFPGGHGGYNDDPAGFAETLHHALAGALVPSTRS